MPAVESPAPGCVKMYKQTKGKAPTELIPWRDEKWASELHFGSFCLWVSKRAG